MHHRLPLLPTAAVTAPNCDICQECHAYFFGVEDRALLCRSCDVAVHSANAFVSAHRRFLLTGVQVGLRPDAQEPEPHPPTSSTAAEAPLQAPPAAKKGTGPAPLYSDDDIDWAAGPDGGISGNLPDWSVVDEQLQKPAEPMVMTEPPSKRSPGGAVTGGMQGWSVGEFFGFSEFNAGLGFTDNGTSKARPFIRRLTAGSSDGVGQVPEVHHQWSVPELPSPPMASLPRRPSP